MPETITIPPGRLTLPLLGTPQAAPAPSWEGFTALEMAEPQQPQGAYNALAPEEPLSIPLLDIPRTATTELLAPAGGPDAAYAAFHFGADAIYLGLKKFSARAEAENFTLEELDEITAYAHSLSPHRRVFVTINTLIRQDELPELGETLAALEDIGVDAVILQDLGVYRALRRYFPRLELHGSTQMAVHNRAGAEALKALGFSRVVLARELTFEEVHDITQAAGIETEVFIHGALCYAYSGLCLFSSQELGRSGNRGKCAYSCRDSYEVTGAPLELRDGTDVKRDPRQGFPFSMKDLALPDHLPALRAAGVSCFKVEGRKKSPLYVATTTDYYRRLLDGRLDAEHRPDIEADLQTVFSRPWTRLFVQSHLEKEVADRDTVGHRGTRIGQVEGIRNGRLRFRTHRPIQRHDGLQIDLPVLGKPFGFAVDQLWVLSRNNKGHDAETYEAPAEAVVEVALPSDHPDLPIGAPVYCSSSQAVKQKYRYEKPKPGLWHVRHPLHVAGVLKTQALTITARVETGDVTQIEEQITLQGPFSSAQDVGAMDRAMHGVFERLGNSPFTLASLDWKNEAGGFVPVSRLNQLRRDLVAKLEAALHKSRRQRTEQILAEVSPQVPDSVRTESFRWSLKIDRVNFLDAFQPADWAGVDEVVIDIARDHPALFRERLDGLAKVVGRDAIRLALPALTRKWEEKAIRNKIDALRAAGWHKWEAANLSAWTYLKPGSQPIDLSTDWSVYVINRLAAEQVLEMGATRFALSPEDGLTNWKALLAEFAQQAVLIVHQDTPLFVAESCAYANLIGGCPGKANCKFESMDMVSSHNERVTALDYHCRTIVLSQGPFCLSTRLKDLAKAGEVNLRADFIYRPYDPLEVVRRWRMIRVGQAIAGAHFANCDRGIL